MHTGAIGQFVPLFVPFIKYLIELMHETRTLKEIVMKLLHLLVYIFHVLKIPFLFNN